jgi:hypothetical protein
MLEKILLTAALVFAAVSMLMAGVLALQTSRLASAQKAMAALSADNAACRGSIAKQNAEISAHQIDSANAKAEIKALSELIAEEAKTQKIKVVERLIKDNSCEERLAIMEDALDEFYKHY